MFTEQQKETMTKVFGVMYEQGVEKEFKVNELAKTFDVTQEKMVTILRAMLSCKYVELHKVDGNIIRFKLNPFGVERYEAYLQLQEFQHEVNEAIMNSAQ